MLVMKSAIARNKTDFLCRFFADRPDV